MFFHNILLRIASLDTLFLCAVGQQACLFVCFFFFFFFFNLNNLFKKLIYLLKKKNKDYLINYCENAAYYNTSPSLSIKERKKRNTYKQQQQNIKTIQNN